MMKTIQDKIHHHKIVDIRSLDTYRKLADQIQENPLFMEYYFLRMQIKAETLLEGTFGGKKLDLATIKDVLADMLWSLDRCAKRCGFTLSEIAAHGIEKRRKHPIVAPPGGLPLTLPSEDPTLLTTENPIVSFMESMTPQEEASLRYAFERDREEAYSLTPDTIPSSKSHFDPLAIFPECSKKFDTKPSSIKFDTKPSSISSFPPTIPPPPDHASWKEKIAHWIQELDKCYTFYEAFVAKDIYDAIRLETATEGPLTILGKKITLDESLEHSLYRPRIGAHS